MRIDSRNALVTGANRGLGLALVGALLAAGAAKVYAMARDPASLRVAHALDLAQVTGLRLDITDEGQVREAGRMKDEDLRAASLR